MVKKIWLVEFPAYQYKESVTDLAHKEGLEVVDVKFKDSFNPELIVSSKEAPKLTKVK